MSRRRIAPWSAAWVLAAVLVFGGCAKPLPADKAAYAGEWRGTGVVLSISSDGNALFEKTAGGSRTSIKGPIQGFEGHDISVGISFISSTIAVSVPPTETNGVWTMTVEGVEVTRAP